VSATATACQGRGRDGPSLSPGASFKRPRPFSGPRKLLDSPTAAQRTFKRGVEGLIRAIDIDHMSHDVDEG
ncbi:MAG: hypothetical protein ACRDPE_20810, partial [Solirubrobacterales bacterium]